MMTIMKRTAAVGFALLAALLSVAPAVAQTSPNLITGQVPTAAQWNSYFSSKQDYLGAPPLLRTGGVLTGLLTTAASTTAQSGINLPQGTAPTTPNNGDLWTTTAGLFAQINGSTVGPFSNTSTPCTTCAVTSAGGNIFLGVQSINLNSGSIVAPPSGTALQIQQVDGAIARISLDAFGNTPVLSCRRADGTRVSTTALLANDEMCSLNAWGYTAPATLSATATGAFRIYAAENWSAGHQGSYARIATTANAATAMTDRVGIENDGGLTLPPTVSGGSKGLGTFNLIGPIYIAGTQIAAANLLNGTTGSGGGVVLATAPTISAPVLAGHPTVEGVTSTGATGTGLFVFGTKPTINDNSTVVASPGKFWNPLYFGNAGTGIVQRFNRVMIGEAALGSSDEPMTTPDWLETLTSGATTSVSALVSVSALGQLGITGASRTSDYRSWTTGASGGSQGGTFYGYNDDTGAGTPIACGVCGTGIRAASVNGITVNQFDINNAGSVVTPTPFGGVTSGSTFAALLTAGALPSLGTANPSAALAMGAGSTAKFRKGIIAFDGALDTSVGAGGDGVAFEMARNMSVRWLNSGGTTDGEMWANANGINIPSGLVLGAFTGSTQCLQVNSSGVVAGTGTACGSSGGGITALTGDVTASGTGSVAATLATAQPAVHTWALAQTFTVAPVFTNQSTSRTALGLGTIATQAASGVAITGGTVAGLTGLAIRDTSAAFDVTIAAVSSVALGAGRTLTIDMVNAARTLKLGSNLTLATDPGAVTGALKSNGTGTFAQAACADLAVTCLTANQTVTLSGDVTGSGATAITTVLATAQPAVHTWALAQTFTTSVAIGGGSIGSDALEVTGTTTYNGGVTVAGAPFTLSGNQSVAAWTTNGVRIKGVTGTLTDTTSTGTVAAAYTDVLGGNTIAASSSTTYTNYTSLYVKAPVTGTNVTFTNGWALGADSLRIGTSNQLTISLTGVLTATSPVFVTPALGVATGTSLALGGCTIGANALCATGTAAISSTLTSAAITVTSASSTALAVGLNGSTNPAFDIDASTASQAAGLKVTGAATGGTVAVAAIDSGSNTNLTVNAKGSGTIGIGSVSTGAVTITPALTLSAALTYGGVTLSNAVTGTGNMVLSASPTLTGTLTAAAGTFSSTLTTNVTGSTQCLHVNSSGVVSGTGSDCGSGSGAVTGVSNSDGTLTISPTTGAVVASIALGHVNAWTAAQSIASASATALAVGLNGTTNPALQVDASTATSATGLKIKSAAAAAGVALSVITSGTNENLTVDAAGSGTITFGATSTGAITFTRAVTLSAALTYGGVTLANSVTGTGSMVLSISPTLTGTLTAAAGAFSSTLSSAANTITSASAQALAVGLNGATNPAFDVDASTALQVAGLKVTGAVTGGTVAVAVIDSGSNASLTLNAKGTGTIGIGSVSTGGVTITPTLTLTVAPVFTDQSGSRTALGLGTAATVNTGTSGATIPLLNGANTWSGVQTFTNSDIALLGSSTGFTTLTSANAGASNFTATLQAATTTLIGRDTTDTLTNKTFDTAGTGNSFSVNGTAITAKTGTGNVVLSASPTFSGTVHFSACDIPTSTGSMTCTSSSAFQPNFTLTNSTNDSSSPNLVMAKSRSGGAVNAADNLGGFAAQAFTTSFVNSGQVVFFTTGAVSGAHVPSAVRFLTSDAAGELNHNMQFDGSAHLGFNATAAPAASSCGTTPGTPAGTDTAGTVTEGTTATGCTLTFAVAYGTAPYCTAALSTGAAIGVSAVSTTAVTFVHASLSSNKLYWHCMGTN